MVMTPARRPFVATPAQPATRAARRPPPGHCQGDMRIDIRRLNLDGYTPAQGQRFLLALETAMRDLASESRSAQAFTTRHVARMNIACTDAAPEEAARRLARELLGPALGNEKDDDHG
jgi:hypothetical protein